MNSAATVADTMTRDEAFVTADALLKERFSCTCETTWIQKDGRVQMRCYVHYDEDGVAMGGSWSEAIADLMKSLEGK